MMKEEVLIVGGGFYGMYLAEYLSICGKNVCLCEKEQDFMQRASYTNQARVHHGYHYPRSVLTALRSRVSFPRFCQEFSDCVDASFDKYYMIGKIQGNVTAKQFSRFCDRIGASYQLDTGPISHLINPALVEAVFSVDEVAFNAVSIKERMRDRLVKAGVNCRLGVSVESIVEHQSGLLAVLNTEDGLEEKLFGQVFNCTYSMLNRLTTKSKLETIPLRHELTEMCLVDVPEPLKGLGITIMCGPFFSTMPFPSRNLNSFSHVRYTPHFGWSDSDCRNYEDGYQKLATYKKRSAWRKMLLDARRYIPILEDCVYSESLWEVKTILPSSDMDDSRPILFLPHHGVKGFHCVLGGKIDNVYDVVSTIMALGLDR